MRISTVIVLPNLTVQFPEALPCELAGSLVHLVLAKRVPYAAFHPRWLSIGSHSRPDSFRVMTSLLYKILLYFDMRSASILVALQNLVVPGQVALPGSPLLHCGFDICWIGAPSAACSTPACFICLQP